MSNLSFNFILSQTSVPFFLFLFFYRNWVFFEKCDLCVACVFSCESVALCPNCRTTIGEPRFTQLPSQLLFRPFSLSFSHFFLPLDYRNLMRIYRHTTTKHRRSSRPSERKEKVETIRDCDTQTVKLTMPHVHGLFIDTGFLRNDTNVVLSDLSLYAYQLCSHRGATSNADPAGSN